MKRKQWVAGVCSLAVMLGCQTRIDSGDAVATKTQNLTYLKSEPLWSIPDVSDCGYYNQAMGDVNGDGKKDLVILSQDCGGYGFEPNEVQLRVYFGANKGFKLGLTAPMPEKGYASFMSLYVFDADGDRFDDMLLVPYEKEGRLYRGGAGLSRLGKPILTDKTQYAYFEEILDLDGNGRADLVRAYSADAPANWLTALEFNPRTQQFDSKLRIEGVQFRNVGDLSGDKLNDYIVRDPWIDGKLGALRVHYGCVSGFDCQNGLTRSGVKIPEPPRSNEWEIPYRRVGDVNGDGREDLQTISRTGVINIYLTTSYALPGTDSAWTLAPDPSNGGFNFISLTGDVDNDGHADLLVQSQFSLTIFKGTARGPQATPGWQWKTSKYHGVQAVMDLDGDGYSDILTTTWEFLGYAKPTIVAFGGGVTPEGHMPPPWPEPWSTCREIPPDAKDLPDFTADPGILKWSSFIGHQKFAADSCELKEQCVGAPGNRKLLYFSAAIQNFGRAAAKVASPEKRPDLYYFDSCHQHYHLIGFAKYELIDKSGEIVSAGHKQGYYMADSVAYCDKDPEAFNSDPDVYMQLSSGWADLYSAGIPCQWIDVTDVADGEYKLRVTVNAANSLDEDDRAPNMVEVSVEIQGDKLTTH